MNYLYSPLKRQLSLFVLTGIFVFLILFDLPWDNTLNIASLYLQYQLRGKRTLSDKIVLIYLDSNDLEAMHGWPITRDYYGYAIHVLNQMGIKVIGFDILFDTADKRYPEYDETLIDFFNSHKNVCLPMAFSEVGSHHTDNTPTDLNLFSADFPVFPFIEFREKAAGIGFSNLSDETVVNKVPLILSFKDTLYYSFGFELARLFLEIPADSITLRPNKIELKNIKDKPTFLPIDQNGCIYLNHFGGIEDIHNINFLDLLHTYQKSGDSPELAGKLAIIAVTAPGYSTLKTTPLSAAIPAVFIHTTVVENIIEQNYLQILPAFYQLLSTLLLVSLVLLILRLRKTPIRIISIILIIIIYYITVMLLFTRLNFILPVIYPSLALIALLTINFLFHKYQLKHEMDLQKNILSSQIAEKQLLLDKTEQELFILKEKHDQEIKNKKNLTDDYQLKVQENKNKILELEKQITDLESYTIPDEIGIKKGKIKFPEFVYTEGSKLVQILDLIHKVSSDDIAVIINGETGTGKELSARAIHNLSKRKNSPFVAINCGALSETLLESELFGHEKGSFTGALTQRKGRFELADGGTIFLDEITETSPAFQVKLLRTLQEKTIERIGGEKSIKVDIRIISASSKNIENEMKAGKFREDLFYRLNGFTITLPPLRERKEDIPLLAVHILAKHRYKSITEFSAQAMEYLMTYNWPGNVRELENVVRRCAILARSEGRDMIRIDDLPDEFHSSSPDSLNYQPIEKQILELLRSLKFKHTAITQTAKILGKRDRGTITEYFRGICFVHLVQLKFNIDLTAEIVAHTNDKEIQDRVKEKLIEYLKNLAITENMNIKENERIIAHPCFKGLPKKYHEYLLQVVRYFSKDLANYKKIIKS
jgi:transcriptional regulator with PAS, ATPase and Fis domain/CHASE2 domain-containing sensor protein